MRERRCRCRRHRHRSPAHRSPRTHSQILTSLVAGVVTGLSGVTGFKGFGVYLACHAAATALLALKAGLAPQRYFASRCEWEEAWAWWKRVCRWLKRRGRASPRPATHLPTHPSPHLAPRWTVGVTGVLSQSELLTFILFWTISNNLCYLF